MTTNISITQKACKALFKSTLFEADIQQQAKGQPYEQRGNDRSNKQAEIAEEMYLSLKLKQNGDDNCRRS